MALPPRTANTMSDAIALSSPNGRMSKRAREAAQKRLGEALFGKGGLIPYALPPQPSKATRMREQAARLRDLASRGMSVRRFTKESARLEIEADELDRSATQHGAANPNSAGVSAAIVPKSL